MNELTKKLEGPLEISHVQLLGFTENLEEHNVVAKYAFCLEAGEKVVQVAQMNVTIGGEQYNDLLKTSGGEVSRQHVLTYLAQMDFITLLSARGG